MSELRVLKKEHPLDEWARLHDTPMVFDYDNRDNLSVTRCQITVTGFDDAKMVLRKSSSGLSIKFAEHITTRNRKRWYYIWEKLTRKEMQMIGAWLLNMSKEQDDGN